MVQALEVEGSGLALVEVLARAVAEVLEGLVRALAGEVAGWAVALVLVPVWALELELELVEAGAEQVWVREAVGSASAQVLEVSALATVVAMAQALELARSEVQPLWVFSPRRGS